MAISLGGFSGGGAGAVTSVNTQTGAVVLDGADIDSTHTPLNYVRSDDTIDGHLTGIDLALGDISADDILADHTAVNYTAANANVDGHLSGLRHEVPGRPWSTAHAGSQGLGVPG